ncbi:MAG: hypothetical protein LQ341_000536 [Variospora aurantia]|nr:MAG: hypothetical protein LQ341_000536 [Variospora aurantia]
MLGISTLWPGFGSANNASRTEKAQAQLTLDLKYLYSAFTKIPCLRLAPDRKARMIRGYEEFPFDTAVPLLAFKNVSALEICDVDFRQFFGWDRLAEQLRSLTLKRAHLEDPSDLLTSIVLDDMDKRRRRSSKAQSSPTLAWPSSLPMGFAEVTKGSSIPGPSAAEDAAKPSTSPQHDRLPLARKASNSPKPATTVTQNTSFRQSSPPTAGTYRTGSSSNLLLVGTLPSLKWRFLRHLSLADNALTSIPTAGFAPLATSLRSLDLSSNLFTEVPDGLANLIVLRALNLSNCMIGSLQSLIENPLPAITALNLRANRLVSIAGIERLLSLERLDLRENKLGDPTELARVSGLSEFREVWVMQNPFTLMKSYTNYRVTIFNLFRNTPGFISDILIDASGPTYNERKQLVDWVPEVESVSVLRRLQLKTGNRPPNSNNAQQKEAWQHVTDSRIDGQGVPLTYPKSHYQHSSITDGYHANPKTVRPPVKSRQSKRGMRRQRLVNLATGEAAHSGSDAYSLHPVLVDQMSAVPLKRSLAPNALIRNEHSPAPLGTQDQAPHDERIVVPHLQASPILPMDGEDDQSSNDSRHTKLRAEAYRQRIEAFKQEVGSNWLSALNEDGWGSDKRADIVRPLPLGNIDMADQNEVDLDSVIDRLLEVRGSRPGKQVQLLETEIRYLCTKAREIFISQPILLELEAPIKASFRGLRKNQANYLFLGDYVDRGKQSLETICLLLAYKIKYPENFFILRGNHECASINRIYGFYDECKRRYNIKLWKTFTDCFNCLPIAAIIDEKIFTMHGGLSPDLNSMEQIRRVMRPTDIPDCGLLCDLLWSDPDKDITGWSENDRGVSFTFGPDVVSRFLQKHDMDLICRAHQVVEDGYEFFSKRQLVTLFSAPNYCGEFDNAGAMMSVDESLLCSFQILKPAEKKQKYVYGGMSTGRPVTPPRKHKKK